MQTRRLVPLLWLGLVLAGCGSDVDDRPVSFAYISTTILEPNCATAGCHSRNVAAGGVRLDNRLDAYFSLVRPGQFITPGDPNSVLMKLLEGNQTWRMPPDGPLPQADIELIRRWIADGARDN